MKRAVCLVQTALSAASQEHRISWPRPSHFEDRQTKTQGLTEKKEIMVDPDKDIRIAKRVKSIMDQNGISAAELGRRMGITSQTIQQYLSGRRSNPTIDFLNRIAKALRCDLSEVLLIDSPRQVVYKHEGEGIVAEPSSLEYLGLTGLPATVDPKDYPRLFIECWSQGITLIVQKP